MEKTKYPFGACIDVEELGEQLIQLGEDMKKGDAILREIESTHKAGQNEYSRFELRLEYLTKNETHEVRPIYTNE